MKKIMAVVVGIMLITMALTGCGKKSALVGKVVDGKGNAMAGVKVVAKQVQPIKGYEQFEATTGSDGGFKFDKLFPTSAYELITYPDGTTKKLSIKTESGPEGQTKTLPEPITVRFQFSKDGATALDMKTGLMWAKDVNIAGGKMNWGQAMGVVSGLDIGGHKGWRLPNKMELEQLAKSAGKEKPADYLNAIGFSNVQASWYWSSTPYEFDSSSAWGVSMDVGGVSNGLNKGYNGSVWPVRSGQ
ncbi:MAG: DUF1566 domain-containing protein [Geobacteraceae bacterium]